MERRDKLMNKRVKKLAKKEEAYLSRKPNEAFGKALGPVVERISEKIPDKVFELYRQAFQKGFSLVLEKGSGWIDHTIDTEKREVAFQRKREQWENAPSGRALKSFGRSAGRDAALSQLIGTVDGVALGALGIGLPDIPILIGMMLRVVRAIASSYGFETSSPEERLFVLSVLLAATVSGEERREQSARTDQLGAKIDQGQSIEETQEHLVEKASAALAGRITGAKAAQGIFLVGAVAGLVNHSVLQDVSKMARFKYEKRMLNHFQGERHANSCQKGKIK